MQTKSTQGQDVEELREEVTVLAQLVLDLAERLRAVEGTKATMTSTSTLLLADVEKRWQQPVFECVQCGQSYQERLNAQGSCKYHPERATSTGGWSSKYMCCNKDFRDYEQGRSVPGCVGGRHVSEHHTDFAYHRYFYWLGDEAKKESRTWLEVEATDLASDWPFWVRVGMRDADGRMFVKYGRGRQTALLRLFSPDDLEAVATGGDALAAVLDVAVTPEAKTMPLAAFYSAVGETATHAVEVGEDSSVTGSATEAVAASAAAAAAARTLGELNRVRVSFRVGPGGRLAGLEASVSVSTDDKPLTKMMLFASVRPQITCGVVSTTSEPSRRPLFDPDAHARDYVLPARQEKGRPIPTQDLSLEVPVAESAGDVFRLKQAEPLGRFDVGQFRKGPGSKAGLDDVMNWFNVNVMVINPDDADRSVLQVTGFVEIDGNWVKADKVLLGDAGEGGQYGGGKEYRWQESGTNFKVEKESATTVALQLQFCVRDTQMGLSNNSRNRALPQLPQPLKLRVTLEELKEGAEVSLTFWQVNPDPLLPSAAVLAERWGVNVHAFVGADLPDVLERFFQCVYTYPDAKKKACIALRGENSTYFDMTAKDWTKLAFDARKAGENVWRVDRWCRKTTSVEVETWALVDLHLCLVYGLTFRVATADHDVTESCFLPKMPFFD